MRILTRTRPLSLLLLAVMILAALLAVHSSTTSVGAQAAPTPTAIPGTVTPAPTAMPTAAPAATPQPTPVGVLIGNSTRLLPGYYEAPVFGSTIVGAVDFTVGGTLAANEKVLVTLISSGNMYHGDGQASNTFVAPNTSVTLDWTDKTIGTAVIVQATGPVTATIDTRGSTSEIQLVVMQYNAASPVSTTVVPTLVPSPTAILANQGAIETVALSKLISYTLQLADGDSFDWVLNANTPFTMTLTSDTRAPFNASGHGGYWTGNANSAGVYDAVIVDAAGTNMVIESGIAKITVSFEVEDSTVPGDLQLVIYRAAPAASTSPSGVVAGTNPTASTGADNPTLPNGGAADLAGLTLNLQPVPDEGFSLTSIKTLVWLVPVLALILGVFALGIHLARSAGKVKSGQYTK